MKELTFANGDTMPALGLGTWKSAPGEVGRAVEEAVDLGYRHFDCAWIYQNEAEIGQAFQRVFARGEVSREDLWITSKLWCNRHRADEVAPALEGTLADLACEYLDLYLVHWPVALKHDVVGPSEGSDFLPLSEVPLRETWGAMEQCAEQGLTRHIGVSNYSVKHLEGHLDAGIVPEVNQVEMHPYLQQPELVSFCKEHGIHLTAYSPLGSNDRPEGMKAKDEPVLLEDKTIGAIADRVGATPAQVLLAWAVQRGTSVIPKSVNPGRMAQNLAAADLALDDATMAEITAMDRGRRYVDGTFWEKPGSGYTVAELWGAELWGA